MFVGCEANATMISVDLANRNVIDRQESAKRPTCWKTTLALPCLCRRRKRMGQRFRS